MRIISGQHKGRRLPSGGGGGKFRPTSDRVREALFNILGELPEETLFGDFYAGSGAVGLEALSRGVRTVHWVEAAGARCQQLRKYLLTLGHETHRHRVHQQKVEAFLASSPPQFALVFADPPYEEDPLAVVERIARSGCLRPGGLLVLEHAARRHAPTQYGKLDQVDSRRYGDTQLTFYRA